MASPCRRARMDWELGLVLAVMLGVVLVLKPAGNLHQSAKSLPSFLQQRL